MSAYYYTKKTIRKQDVSKLYLHFDNGDYATVAAGEIYSLSITHHDRLITGGRGFIPVASGGYLKLNLSNKSRIAQMAHEVENDDAYRKQRRTYLTERLLREGDLREIWFFNDLNWHYAVACRAEAIEEGECLILRFLPQQAMGECDSKTHRITLSDPKKAAIAQINVDFENCEYFVVHNDEIEDCQLVFSPELEWSSSELCRKIIGGHITLNLQYRKREGSLFEYETGHPKREDYLRRLCGKGGEEEVDISHLYVTYYGPGYSQSREECLETEQIGLPESPKSERSDLIKASFGMRNDEQEDEDDIPYENYVSGYAKRCRDGKVVVTFGENASREAAIPTTKRCRS